jgi:hypothetical protein
MTVDEAIDRVIDYLTDAEERHYLECSPSERRNHIWRAVMVLMAHRDNNKKPPKVA